MVWGLCRSKKLLEKLGSPMKKLILILIKSIQKVSELQNRKPRIPTIVFEDGSYLVEPTDVELLEKINSYQS